MEIIGQEKLLSKLNNYTLETLPKSMLFCGETGCGKHMVAEALAKKFNFALETISENVTHEQLIDYSQRPTKTLYLIELKKFTSKQQNQFLKFIEEPSASVYTIILAHSEIGVLPTILNRCIKFYFDPYTPEELQKLSFEKYPLESIFYKICNTPGKMVGQTEASITKIYNTCNFIVDNIKKASWANTLKLSTKINFKEEYDKFDFNLFLDTLEYAAFEKYKQANNPLNFIIYSTTNEAKQSMLDKVIVKENFMLGFLTKLWKETR